MRNVYRLVILSLHLCVALQLNAQKGKVATANVPEWVKATPVNYDLAKLETEAEDGYLNVAYVKQVNLPEQTTYIHKSFKIINEQGIENNSEVTVWYDPSYQKLIFHDVFIVRDGKNIDKLKKAKFSLLQQEEDAYMHQYNGNLTALLLLDDVRIGDIIEYSYSIKGFNPVFEGRYADFYSAAFSVPVGQLYYRSITDSERQLYIENSNLDVAPAKTRNGNLRMYEWSFTDVAPIHTDDNLPSWYDAYPMVMVSEYNDWLSIRQWAARLFPNNVPIDGLLRKKIETIKSQYATNDLRATAAIRFVQDEVRYLGIEMGTGTHKPANPNKTFAQRYGDCKDKTYLLVTMLSALGIEATPVFVNSSMKQGIANWIPSPKVFDHVTVRMTVDGIEHFVDPTIINQRGSLADISYPKYKQGLVLADSSAGLTTIYSEEPGMVKVKEVFSIPDMDGHATLTVTTTHSGTFADDVRSAFKNNSIFEMQKSYKQFYSTYFPKIKGDTVYYKDDEQTGTFVVSERYTIEDLWTIEDGIKKCSFTGFVINSYLTWPKDKLRTMPMAMYYPAKCREEIEINLPEDWSLNDFDKEIVSRVFRYKGKSTLNGNVLKLVFDYEALKDFVAPAETSELLANYKEIEDGMGWQLTYNSAGSSNNSSNTKVAQLSPDSRRNINLRLTVFVLIVGGIITFLVIRNRRRQAVERYF